MSEVPLHTGGADVIRKEAWSFYRTISCVRLCWELEELKVPKGLGRWSSQGIQLAEGGDGLGEVGGLRGQLLHALRHEPRHVPHVLRPVVQF